ncbi:hypothetical protein J7E99_15705 [Streptomyces sp. ISL-44]|uniref:hypothetical protein n=1 Tax=Streptomyces sp. ISL-44 TaxID=2819184 RepID=UPI001BE7F9CA|nr:hypothetical protein [Streptomyces sp. ISL-44]MBT2542114.1 hypothetical protein [Streptomyces sp. ISL-44]
MTSRTMPRCTRRVLSLDTPDDARAGIHAVGTPSPDLLDRALVGWEHFIKPAAPEAIRVALEPQTAAEAVS